MVACLVIAFLIMAFLESWTNKGAVPLGYAALLILLAVLISQNIIKF